MLTKALKPNESQLSHFKLSLIHWKYELLSFLLSNSMRNSWETHFEFFVFRVCSSINHWILRRPLMSCRRRWLWPSTLVNSRLSWSPRIGTIIMPTSWCGPYVQAFCLWAMCCYTLLQNLDGYEQCTIATWAIKCKQRRWIQEGRRERAIIHNREKKSSLANFTQDRAANTDRHRHYVSWS